MILKQTQFHNLRAANSPAGIMKNHASRLFVRMCGFKSFLTAFTLRLTGLPGNFGTNDSLIEPRNHGQWHHFIPLVVKLRGMLKQIFTMICCTACALATGQVVNDPYLLDKTGMPAHVRPSPSLRYQNRQPQQMPRLGPRTTPLPVTEGYTPGSGIRRPGFEESTSPLRYNSPADDQQSWLDTVRIFYFDADGKRYNNPSQIYRDLEQEAPQPTQSHDTQPQNNSYRREEDSNVAPWERSNDTDSDDD